MQGTPWATADGANAAFVGAGALAAGRVHDELNLAVDQIVEHVGMPFLQLLQPLARNAGLLKRSAVPAVAMS